MATRNKIIRTIIEKKIEIAIFDPLAAMHSMPEKDNVVMAELIYDFFGPIAYQTKAAIEIVHHTRKGPAGVEMEYTAADWRGGSAATFALRGVRVCNVMKKSEAEKFEINELDRLSYFRITRGKNNMTRMGDMGWRQFVPVVLKNGNPDKGEDDEEVGVVRAYSPPPTEESLGFYNDADKEHWRNLVADDNAYGVHPQSRKWFGGEIAKRLGLDLVGKHRKKHHAVVKAILWELIESAWLKVVSRIGDDRREHQYLEVGDGNPPEAGTC
jgi:hypothetical protein